MYAVAHEINCNNDANLSFLIGLMKIETILLFKFREHQLNFPLNFKEREFKKG